MKAIQNLPEFADYELNRAFGNAAILTNNSPLYYEYLPCQPGLPAPLKPPLRLPGSGASPSQNGPIQALSLPDRGQIKSIL
jgi:hypothetical protein